MASELSVTTPSLQLIGHFVDPGLDASFVLFTARRARSARCADDLIAHLDRQRALVGYDVGEMDQTERRIGLSGASARTICWCSTLSTFGDSSRNTRPITMRFEPTFRSVRMRPADGPSNGSETLSRIQSLADYTIAMLESSFRKRQPMDRSRRPGWTRHACTDRFTRL